MKGNNNTPRTRKSRQEQGEKRIVQDKFVKERANRAPPLVAKNENQKKYFRFLHTKQMVIAMGDAGSGKSFCAAANAADKYIKGDVEGIIVARPFVQMGKTCGFTKGDTNEKLYPYVRNILDTIRKRIGDGSYEGALGRQIEIQALESIRGRSFDDHVIVIIDEAQNSTPEEMKSIITRVGEHAQLVICGDPAQKDIVGLSGLEWLCDFVRRHNISSTGIIEFTENDCVRSGIVGEILHGLKEDYANKDNEGG